MCVVPECDGRYLIWASWFLNMEIASGNFENNYKQSSYSSVASLVHISDRSPEIDRQYLFI